jgi:peptidoglycan/xylan/chitin deacetylase (PgdA/CDA1 family)
MSSRTDGGAKPRDFGVDILMYHSIGAEPGPTSIPVETFARQMELLVETGCTVLSLAELAKIQRGELDLPPRTVMITFDDGFSDFADKAFPILKKHGHEATVFLPTGCLGGSESWNGANVPPRPLMSWSVVQDLSREGMEFGGHSVTHADLTMLPPDRLREEVERSQKTIEEQLGKPAETFAPPYGRSNSRVREELARWSRVSVGTGLGRAGKDVDLTDAPRIEMHYFRRPALFRAYLLGRAEWYLGARKAARSVRSRLRAHRRAGE